MILFFVIILIIALIIFFFVRQPKFGKLPSGERLQTIKNSPNYKNGAFQNLSNTPAFTEGTSYYQVLKEFIFSDKSNAKPKQQIPSVKTDLLHLDISQDILVWFGHSSYFMQVDGKRILVDPVLSGSASPLPKGTKAFAGSDIYSTDDIPAIDFLFITHDHWDHLDYKTVVKLREKTCVVICGLGIAAHLEHWGYDIKRIIEKDWNESFEIDNGFTAYTVLPGIFQGEVFGVINPFGRLLFYKHQTIKYLLGAIVVTIHILKKREKNSDHSTLLFWKTGSTTKAGNTYT